MLVKAIPLGEVAANCYLIKTDDAAIVIDPASADSEVVEFLNSNSNANRIILLTHCHFDHISGAKELREKTGVKIAIHKNDAKGLFDPVLNASAVFGFNIPPFKADIILEDKESINLGNTKIEVLLTPGHTQGSVCYILEDMIFSGDTLFKGSVGRCDLPSGDFNTLMNSLGLLKGKKDKDYTVFSGHGGKTTLREEIAHNPYFVGMFNESM